MNRYDDNTVRIRSFITLRRAVGWIGILLPFVLLAGDALLFHARGARLSISSYYCTGMRDVLVGSLCSVGLFLLFYKGYVEDRYGLWDRWLTNIAGVAAICMAWFPNSCVEAANLSSWIHLFCGILFFTILASISIFLFTRTRETGKVKGRKRTRNMIYIASGIIIYLSMAGMFFFYEFYEKDHPESAFIFYAETLSLVAFGTSWLTKGKAFRLRPKKA
jgi:hypothetical protein